MESFIIYLARSLDPLGLHLSRLGTPLSRAGIHCRSGLASRQWNSFAAGEIHCCPGLAYRFLEPFVICLARLSFLRTRLPLAKYPL